MINPGDTEGFFLQKFGEIIHLYISFFCLFAAPIKPTTIISLFSPDLLYISNFDMIVTIDI